jgi:Holliday junction resolvasome RuvABC endonuclease subunit
MIAVGIDPGLTGAAAFVDSRGTCAIIDMPTVALAGTGLIRRRIDGGALARGLREYCPIGEPRVVAIEAVRTMGGQNNAVQTQGSLMRSLGAIEAVLEVLRLDFQSVEPQVWKGFYGLGSDKKESMAKALSLYPDAPIRLAKDHNKAEALLIAHWMLRTSQG